MDRILCGSHSEVIPRAGGGGVKKRVVIIDLAKVWKSFLSCIRYKVFLINAR